MPLDEAIWRFVAPRMHLHFASTPSRANAAVRAVCRAFRGAAPAFTLSTTGFHSSAHLLGLLGLGERYVAAFFGDNYPSPRPNALYQRLSAEGAELEHWSLLSYVAALRAGALGHPYGVTTSILGSSLEAELGQRGRFVAIVDPCDPSRRVGLVAAVRPDVAFVHVPAADAHGRAIGALPSSEGIWGALAARFGVVVTAERIVDESVTRQYPEAILLPPHRVLAVCKAPFGAHPQSLFAPPHLGLPSYGDDFDAYDLFRELAMDDGAHAELLERVLLSADGDETYTAHFDLVRRAPTMATPASSPSRGARPLRRPAAADRLVILAARRIARLVRAKGFRVILAGVGHAFFAARLAKLWLEREGVEVDLLVETGMLDFDGGPASGTFLLGYDVIARSRRLTSIDDVLGAITCGSDNRCLGVIGAAQIDARGHLNSTRLGDGTLLVGSGGANDIASSAQEVVVLASCEPGRLVRSVPYVTSPGHRVFTVVTDAGILCRDEDGGVWRIEDAIDERAAVALARTTATDDPSERPSHPGESEAPSSQESDPLSWRELSDPTMDAPSFDALADLEPGARLRYVCPWPLAPETSAPALPPSAEELTILRSLHPKRGNRRPA